MTWRHLTIGRSRLWWWIGGGAAVVVIALLVAALVYIRGQKVWTDGMDVVISRDQARVRDVVWLEPEPVGGQFNTPAQEYEVCISPDGDEMYFVRGLPGKGADLYVSYRQRGKWGKPEPEKTGSFWPRDKVFKPSIEDTPVWIKSLG